VGKTTIIATHTLELVSRVADTLLILSERHRPLACGATPEILANIELLTDANLVE